MCFLDHGLSVKAQTCIHFGRDNPWDQLGDFSPKVDTQLIDGDGQDFGRSFAMLTAIFDLSNCLSLVVGRLIFVMLIISWR